MGPKKNKARKKGTGKSRISSMASEGEAEKLLHIERQLFEIKIEELEKQVGRLRAHSVQLESQYDDAIANFKKLDEDRSDIIAYLKRTVQHKVDEIDELNERNSALKKSSDKSILDLQKCIDDLKAEHKATDERMSSEIKLLNGKLTSLEEFRAAREELNNKFSVQEQNIAAQEEHYKQYIYELQKEHLLTKNKLRREMEENLVKLSTDFQKTIQNRIASTTQNVIRENIAINNELFLLIGSWQEIRDENEKLKERLKEVTLDGKLTKEQLEKTLTKNVIQAQVIDKMACEHSRIVSFADEYFQDKAKIKTLETLNSELEKEKRNCVFEMQILRQKNNELLVQIDEQIVNFNKLQCHNSKLERVIHKVTIAVKEALGLGIAQQAGVKVEEAVEYDKKQSVLNTMLQLLSEDFLLISIPEEGEASVPTIPSEGWMEYQLGDLGLAYRTSTIG